MNWQLYLFVATTYSMYAYDKNSGNYKDMPYVNLFGSITLGLTWPFWVLLAIFRRLGG